MKRLVCLLLLIGQSFTQSVAASPHDPERNFEVFWQLFNRHYAHFENRGVDWNGQYSRFRPLVNSKTADAELLTILNQMVAPLRDGHVVISPTGDLPASAKYSRFYSEFPTKMLQEQFHQVSLAELKKKGFGPFTEFASAPYHIGGYCRSKEYGYLQLNGFGGMALTAFANQLDEMVAAFADVKGLIVDIRINGGGSGDFLYAVVGRLTQVKRLVGYARTRCGGTRCGGTRTGKPNPDYTPWTAYHVAPQGNQQLIKPTILLTSSSTISAGDHCAMYLRQFPYVRLMGERSNGIFSPMLGKKLPNGWEISLSNGQTVDAKRVSYEGKGVSVDVPALHHRDTMLAGLDPVLDNAITYLRTNESMLVASTICPEQIALNFYADSLLTKKTYGDVTAYSTGLVEEDATLLAPFAVRCLSLKTAQYTVDLRDRLREEQRADASFYQKNVQSRFFVNTPSPIRSRMRWPFVRRNARRLTVAHHITIDDKHYVRLHLSQGAWKGETVLIIVDATGQVIDHCALSVDYLNSQAFQ